MTHNRTPARALRLVRGPSERQHKLLRAALARSAPKDKGAFDPCNPFGIERDPTDGSEPLDEWRRR